MQQIISKPSASAPAEKYVHINLDKDIILQGVSNILQSNDKEIVLTMGDNTLTLCGDGFNIDVFDVSKSNAQISGKLSSLRYSKGHEKMSLIKRLIK